MSAVAYLASYLSRGKFLTASFVANILERLFSVFLSSHLIYQLLKNWFLISCVLFYVYEVSGWWFGVWNIAKSMMVT